MQGLGIPFDGPIPVAEDNAATPIIAHTKKLTRNICHIALKTLSLQALIRERLALFRTAGSAQNKTDHFTKCLALLAFRAHGSYLMGLRFVTSQRMPSSSDDSEWTLRLPERKSNYPLVRGGDVTSQISPVPYELSHVWSTAYLNP
jgi:hypothetical protein